MEFRMLGPLEAWHDGAQVQLGDQQQRFVLVVLLLHANKPVSTERLTEIVWNGNPARKHLVRGYINKLRNAFKDAHDTRIDTTPTGYVLRVDDDQLDVSQFDRLRAEAASAIRKGDEPRAIELLRAAVRLWRGRYLEDVDLDRVGGGDVIIPYDAYQDAVGDLAELELAAGDYRSARDRLRHVVRTAPDSPLHVELLMRALLAAGDRVGAIRVFRRSRDALAEFGVEPGPRLRNLAARAERGEPVSSLPSRPGAFTGRSAELAAIEAAASAPGERPTVWVSGAPGVGKTGLAVEAAHRLRDRFSDGQLLVRLNGFTPYVPAMSVSDALTQLLGELGVPPEQIPPTMGRKVTLYQTKLFGTRTLVVLDNAISPDQARPLLPEAPGCMAIVTSRRMGDPDITEHIRLSPLPREDAVALFRALTDARVRGRSTEVAEVVQRCGFLPMPIRIAAALFRRHASWPLDHLVRLLGESGPWRADAGDADGTTAVRVSYQQLNPSQQTMFRLLGHLPGPDLEVTGAAALGHCEVTAARLLLDELHEVSLLEEVGLERYQMLDPIKEFATADLPPASPAEGADAVLRLLDFYLVTLTAAVRAGYPFDTAQPPTVDRSSPVAQEFGTEEAALDWIEAERDNLVAAIRYADRYDQPEHVWRLAVLLWRHFNTTSQLEDWTETLERARRIVFADVENEYGQAQVLLRLALAYRRSGKVTEALELAAQALPKWVRLGDVGGEAATLCALANPTAGLGKQDEAIAHFAAALSKYEQIGDLRGQAHALSMLGHLNELRGDLDVALRQHQAAVPMLREIRHLRGLAHALDNLGSVQQRLGRPADALASHTEAYRFAGEVGDRCMVAYALNNIGNTHRLRGKLADAVRYQERAKAVAAEVNDVHLRTQLYLDRGATARAREQWADALHAYHAALDLAAGTGHRTHQAHANHGVARVRHAMDRHDSAVEHWDVAEAGFAALGQPEASEIRAERAALSCPCGIRL